MIRDSSSPSVGMSCNDLRIWFTTRQRAMTWYMRCFLRTPVASSFLYPIAISNSSFPSFSYVFPIVRRFSSIFRSPSCRLEPGPFGLSRNGIPSAVPCPVRYILTMYSQSLMLVSCSPTVANVFVLLLCNVLYCTPDPPAPPEKYGLDCCTPSSLGELLFAVITAS